MLQRSPGLQILFTRCKKMCCLVQTQLGMSRSDLGIFPLIGIANFERGPKPDFFLFLNVSNFFMSEHKLWQNADAHVTLLWQICR